MSYISTMRLNPYQEARSRSHLEMTTILCSLYPGRGVLGTSLNYVSRFAGGGGVPPSHVATRERIFPPPLVTQEISATRGSVFSYRMNSNLSQRRQCHG